MKSTNMTFQADDGAEIFYHQWIPKGISGFQRVKKT